MLWLIFNTRREVSSSLVVVIPDITPVKKDSALFSRPFIVDRYNLRDIGKVRFRLLQPFRIAQLSQKQAPHCHTDMGISLPHISTHALPSL